MTNLLFKLLRFSGLPFIFRTLFQTNRTTILLFHDVDTARAQSAFQFLSKAYNIISLKEFLEAKEARDPRRLPKRALILTFDDGHKGNRELLPLFTKEKIPVTIFLCSSIIGTKRHFWFKHDDLFQKVGYSVKRVPNSQRLHLLEELGFSQTSEYATRQALSHDEIIEMMPVVDFQAHTQFHPILPACSPDEARSEIFDSKSELEQRLGLSIYAISYPNGDYSERDIELCKEAGYSCGITVDFGYNSINTPAFKLKRFSVNEARSLDELAVKASGAWAFLRFVLRGMRSPGYWKAPLA